MPTHQLITLSNTLEASEHIVNLICQTASQYINKNGRFVMILAGGTSPATIYRLLKNKQQDWSKWHLIYGDERYLPNHDTERNSYRVSTDWTNDLTAIKNQHYIVNYESSLLATAKAYEQAITPLLPADFALLGIGEDGHTASLFPHNIHDNLMNPQQVLAIDNANKLPLQRISLNYAAINTSTDICLLGFGKRKEHIIKQWRNNIALPFNCIQGKNSTILVTDFL